MLAVSTTWNFSRHGALAPAVRELAEIGFGAVELRAQGAVPDPAEAGETCRALRMRCLSVHAPLTSSSWDEGDPSRYLASTDGDRRRRAVAAVLESLRAAAEARARVVVVHLGEVEVDRARARQRGWLVALERGDPVSDPVASSLAERRDLRNPHLEAAARSLFELCRAEPEVTWALENRYYYHEIPDLEEVELLLADAPGKRVAYWHDTGHARIQELIAGTDALAWLDRHGSRTAGLHLHDVAGLTDHLPPGAGEVDWTGLAGLLSRSMIRVLEVHRRHDLSELRAGAAFVRDLGL